MDKDKLDKIETAKVHAQGEAEDRPALMKLIDKFTPDQETLDTAKDFMKSALKIGAVVSVSVVIGLASAHMQYANTLNPDGPPPISQVVHDLAEAAYDTRKTFEELQDAQDAQAQYNSMAAGFTAQIYSPSSELEEKLSEAGFVINTDDLSQTSLEGYRERVGLDDGPVQRQKGLRT